jgi:hypothetical protein
MQHVSFEHREDRHASGDCLRDALWKYCAYAVVAKVKGDTLGWVERYYDGGVLVGAISYSPDGAPIRAQFSDSLQVPNRVFSSSN